MRTKEQKQSSKKSRGDKMLLVFAEEIADAQGEFQDRGRGRGRGATSLIAHGNARKLSRAESIT